MASTRKKAEAKAETPEQTEDNLITSGRTAPIEYGPADPVEVDQLSQMGSTFAERAKARLATEKRIGAAENK